MESDIRPISAQPWYVRLRLKCLYVRYRVVLFISRL